MQQVKTKTRLVLETVSKNGKSGLPIGEKNGSEHSVHLQR